MHITLHITDLCNDLRCYWDMNYSMSNPPPTKCKLGEIDTASNRVVDKASFSNAGPYALELEMFEGRHPHLEVQSVWFIEKSQHSDGFQCWLQDLVNNAQTAITIVVNVGSVLNDDNDESYSLDSSNLVVGTSQFSDEQAKRVGMGGRCQG